MKRLTAWLLVLLTCTLVVGASQPRTDSACDSGECESFCWAQENLCEFACFGIFACFNACTRLVPPCLRQCYDTCGPQRN
jgi:hypothetical protein